MEESNRFFLGEAIRLGHRDILWVEVKIKLGSLPSMCCGVRRGSGRLRCGVWVVSTLEAMVEAADGASDLSRFRPAVVALAPDVYVMRLTHRERQILRESSKLFDNACQRGHGSPPGWESSPSRSRDAKALRLISSPSPIPPRGPGSALFSPKRLTATAIHRLSVVPSMKAIAEKKRRFPQESLRRPRRQTQKGRPVAEPPFGFFMMERDALTQTGPPRSSPSWRRCWPRRR